MLNGEQTTSQYWPEFDGMVHDGLEGVGIGIIDGLQTREIQGGEQAMRWNTSGFYFIVVPKALGEFRVFNAINIDSTGEFTRNEIVIDGVDYIIRHITLPVSNPPALALDLTIRFD